jgi:hypothetical protein
VSRSRTVMTAYAGILASVAATAFVLAAPWHWLSFAGALLLACVPAGAGVMCWIDSGEDTAQAGLTLVVSLSLFAIASALMIWLAAWHPSALIVLAGASVISCATRLSREARRSAGAPGS